MKELTPLIVMKEVMKSHAEWQDADDWWIGAETPHTNCLMGWDANIVDNTFCPELPDGWHMVIVYELEIGGGGHITSGSKPVLFKFPLPFMPVFTTLQGKVESNEDWSFSQVNYDTLGDTFALEFPKFKWKGDVEVAIAITEVS